MKRIAHLSDLHFGTENPQVAQGLLEELSELRPNLVVVSGDLTQRARRREFLAARAWLESIPAPLLTVPGNHDIPLYNLFARLFDPLARYRRHITSELDPFYADDEIAVAGVNSARLSRWKEGRISFGQMARIQERFGGVPSDRFKVLVCHHPFIPPEDRSQTTIVGRSRLALKMLETSGCALILSGHLHRAYSGDVRPWHLEITRSILAAQAGTAISNRRREEPNAWNQLTIDGDRLLLEVRAWNGIRFAPTGQREYRRTESGWTDV